jgi:hypothetical protein
MRPSKFLILALSLTALLALVAAGCGGGGGGETTASTETTAETTPSLTKSELISQGDAICAEVNAAIGSVGSSAADTKSQVEQVATLYTGMVSSLKRLGTPKEDSAGYAEFISAAEELAKVEGEAKLAAEREDTAALGEVATKAAPTLENFETTAAVYGFEKCSEGPSAPTAPATSGSTPEAEEGGVEAAPEVEEEVVPEEAAPEEVAPETGGAGGGIEEAPPAEGGGESGGGGTGGGIGPSGG